MRRIRGRGFTVAVTGLIFLAVASIEAGTASAAVTAPAAPTYAVTATIPVGHQPASVAVNPQTGRVYVANGSDNTVSVVTTADDTVTATVPVGGVPYSIAVNAVTNNAYVTTGIGGNGAHPGDLVVIDGANAVSASRALQQDGDGPHFGDAVNTLTNTVYVTHFYGGTVSEISASTLTTTAVFAAGPIVTSVAVNELTNTLYVANLDNGTVTVINGVTHRQIATIPVGGRTGSIALDPSRRTAYVATDANTVAVIDTATNTVVATVPVGQGPGRIAVDPSAGVVYVPNSADNTVSVIDQATNTVIATVAVGTAPNSVAVDPGTHTAYVTNNASNTVSVIRTIASAPVVTNLPTGAIVGGSFTATVDTTGDGTRSVSSSTPTVCSTSGLMVTYVSAGTCTLTAAVAAGAYFGAAAGSPQSFQLSMSPATTTATTPPSSTQVLADTGFKADPLVPVGLALVAAGVGAIAVRRRTRPHRP
jgi:YVTN family beta-propeller protein